MKTARRFRVKLTGGASTSAITYAPPGKSVASLVLGHGAGAPQTHPVMVRLARGLAERGVETTTFNFLYSEEGRRAPDPKEKLTACMRDVLAHMRARAMAPLAAGGRSMGGRIASYLAAEEEPGISALVLFSYPLHPPGKPAQLRSEHLPAIRVPTLFVQGTRDTFGTPDELTPHVAKMKAASIVAVEGGDHGFHVPKSAGRPDGEVLSDVADAVLRFLTRAPGAGRARRPTP